MIISFEEQAKKKREEKAIEQYKRVYLPYIQKQQKGELK